MFIRVPSIILSFLFITSAFSQNAKPKLVVGLVVDQMRWDYLYKYESLYTANGFKRLLKDGFSSENNMIPYVPTYTAPGHACVYTGSVPAIHGIAGNNWYDTHENKFVYCTDDSTVSGVGSNTKAGKMSPKNMWATSVADELRIATNFKSKVIGIALKDRGAILPAGHSANAAYWYEAGKWITSTHYINELPQWVNAFNDKDWAGQMMRTDWTTLLPLARYDLSTADDKPYENNIKGLQNVTFPHKLSTIGDKDKYEAFRTTPFANKFTFDFAKAAIENENLGKNAVADFLAVSISSTDYIGHAFGPNSVEIEDTYLRLDRDIADFLLYLDTKIGKGNYTFFLSADHGVAHIPGFAAENKLPGGLFDDAGMMKEINAAIEEKFAVKNAIKTIMNYQVYVNKDNIKADGKDVEDITDFIIDALKQKDFIIGAYFLNEIGEAALPQTQIDMMRNGYNPKRSGDIQFTVKPGYFEGGKKGTTHGAWNPYDTHIPCIFFGWGVKPGKTYRETYMTDIAPTIAALLKIQMPSGCVGKVIAEAIK
jgi:predicted AlkP superfamily pyrophosphatase or phosphodiesterase